MFVTKLSDSKERGTQEREGKKKAPAFQALLQEEVGRRKELSCDTKNYTKSGKMTEFLHAGKVYGY